MTKLASSFRSEFGIDYGLSHGHFNASSSSYAGDFSAYWWKETCKFENFLREEFREDQVFVSDHVPNYKSFGISPHDRTPLDRLSERCLFYLQKYQPDASVVLAHPLNFPLGSGRIVLTPKHVWLDYDLLHWLLRHK